MVKISWINRVCTGMNDTVVEKKHVDNTRIAISLVKVFLLQRLFRSPFLDYFFWCLREIEHSLTPRGVTAAKQSLREPGGFLQPGRNFRAYSRHRAVLDRRGPGVSASDTLSDVSCSSCEPLAAAAGVVAASAGLQPSWSPRHWDDGSPAMVRPHGDCC